MVYFYCILFGNLSDVFCAGLIEPSLSLLLLMLFLLLGLYGSKLNIFNWTTRELIQEIDLGYEEGALPLEIRFKHDPDSTEGFVGCALSSTMFRFIKTPVRLYTCMIMRKVKNHC